MPSPVPRWTPSPAERPTTWPSRWMWFALRATGSRREDGAKTALAAENPVVRSAIAGRKLPGGHQRCMLELYKQIARSRHRSHGSHHGESGSGKSWSRGLSTSAAAVPSIPLSRFSCASLAEGILESRAVRSTERGAFTGASASHRDCSKPPRGHHFSGWRSGTSRARCRASCCGSCRKARWRRVGGSAGPQGERSRDLGTKRAIWALR